MLQRSSFRGAATFLLLVLAIATVASVPTSVLVQNSEMASNSMGKNGNNLNQNNKNNLSNGNLSNLKVKRSSNGNNNIPNNMKESAASAAAALNKKSSPEIVPASYNSPPQTASSSSSMTNSMRPGNNAGIVSSLPTNGDIINSAIAAGLTAAAIEAAAAASQRELEQQQQQQYVADDYGNNNDEIESPTLLRKRGINSQYLYGLGANGAGSVPGGYGYGYGGSNSDYYNIPAASLGALPVGRADTAAALVSNGIWTDEVDPQLAYTDLQEFDDYAPRAPYHNKAYDNLQNILNSETYLEPVALPLQYPSRYYGADVDRKKRSNLNKFNKKYKDLRLKRDTKLTPADMLALVALVEAGERARKETDVDTSTGSGSSSYLTYPDPYSSIVGGNSNNYNSYSPKKGYYPTVYDLDEVDDEYNGGSVGTGMGAGGAGAWVEPVVDYYGVPYNIERLSMYELPPREHKYASNNRYSNKRFMVSKKKRSMGQFLNEPVAKPSFSYSSGNAEKYF